MVDLGTLDGAYSNAVAVNKSGEVVGNSSGAGETPYHAFAWTAKGGMRDLGVITGASGSTAAAVNERGQVVGSNMNGIHHAFSWTESGGMVDLGTLGGLESSAFAVNAGGRVVGVREGGNADEQRRMPQPPPADEPANTTR